MYSREDQESVRQWQNNIKATCTKKKHEFKKDSMDWLELWHAMYDKQ